MTVDSVQACFKPKYMLVCRKFEAFFCIQTCCLEDSCVERLSLHFLFLCCGQKGSLWISICNSFIVLDWVLFSSWQLHMKLELFLGFVGRYQCWAGMEEMSPSPGMGCSVLLRWTASPLCVTTLLLKTWHWLDMMGDVKESHWELTMRMWKVHR